MKRRRNSKKFDIVGFLLLMSMPVFALTMLALLLLAKENSPAAINSLVEVQADGQTETIRSS